MGESELAGQFIEPLFKGDPGARLKWRRGPLVGIPLALFLTALTVYLRVTLEAYFQVPAIFIFAPAIIVSALVGGLTSGILSLVLATLGSWYFFLQPAHSWALTPDNITALVLFVIVFGANIALIEIVVRALQNMQAERLRMSVALRAATMGLWRGHATTGRRLWSPETFDLFDYGGEADGRDIKALTDFMHPDDRDMYRKSMAQALADPNVQDYDVEYRILRRDGEVRWLRSRAHINRRADGSAEWLDGGVVDITRLKSTERHLEILLFEVQHRIKNFYAVVQAIANLTLPKDGAMKASRDIFLNRLMALSRANIMLVHQENAGLWLVEVLKEELSAFPDQIEIEGCAILLKPNVAQSFALAVHELATNAIKYGALSSPDGRVKLSGGIESEGDKALYHFAWRESGGVTVDPTAGEGYGRSLLANLCEGLGRANWNLAAGGLQFDLVCELSRLVPPAQTDAPPDKISGKISDLAH